jgi:spermidine synthase
LLLLLSGAAGLSYEVVWVRSLTNVLGSSAVAVSTILAAFMAGMAAGALVLGRLADRLRRPLLLYALLELALGACALVLPHWIGTVGGLDHLLGGGGGRIPFLSKAVSAGLILLVPTFAMGGTLPAIATFMVRDRIGGGAYFTVLYGVHVFGAAAGALVASFVLIPAFGLSGTSAVGAIANFAVAGVATALGLRRPDPAPASVDDDGLEAPPDAAPVDGEEEPRGRDRGMGLATAYLSGFVLLGCEVVYVRTLVLALIAKVHSFALMLAVFLVGLSLGSLLAGRLPARRVREPRTLGLILLAGAAGLLVSRDVPIRWSVPLLLSAHGGVPGFGGEPPGAAARVLLGWLVNAESGVQPGEYVVVALVLSLLCLLPFTVPLGMVLPLILRRLAFAPGRTGRRTGDVIFWNTLGTVTGPLVAPYLLVPTFSLLGTLWVFAGITGLGGAAWFLVSGRRGSRRKGLAAGIAVVAVVALLAAVNPRFDGSPELDSARICLPRIFGRERATEVLFHREGATGTVTVVELPAGLRTIRLDGFEAAGTLDQTNEGYHYMKLMAHLPALLHGPEDVERALVICTGTGGTAGAMSLHVRERVELVDIHPEVLDCLGWFGNWNRWIGENPRCLQIADDGRAVLRQRRNHYDVITLEPMPPQFAGMTQLYSREFYESCLTALRPGGVVCQWLPLHCVTRDQALSMTRAMAEVFRTVQVWRVGTTGILVGTMREELPLDRDKLLALDEDHPAREDLIAAGLATITALAECFVCDASRLEETYSTCRPVRDDDPFLEYETIGYGLKLPSPRQMADRWDPFYAAGLTSRLPLAGFEAPEGKRLTTSWRVSSLARYAKDMESREQYERARDLLRTQLRGDPALEAPLRERLPELFPIL